jgi:hypothetical protein
MVGFRLLKRLYIHLELSFMVCFMLKVLRYFHTNYNSDNGVGQVSNSRRQIRQHFRKPNRELHQSFGMYAEY